MMSTRKKIKLIEKEKGKKQTKQLKGSLDVWNSMLHGSQGHRTPRQM